MPGKLPGSLAAASAIAGVAAGVLSNLLTSHPKWATFCGLLVACAFLALTAGLNARREGNGARPPAVNSPADGLPYTSFIYTDNSYSNGPSVRNLAFAGRDINYRTKIKIVYQNGQATLRKISSSLLIALALIALAVAVGGTYMYKNPALEDPAALAAEAGHGSPVAAVEGFFGNSLQNNWTQACSYEPPSEQDTCSAGEPETGRLAVGIAIIEGTRALVPISGRLCRFGECRNFQGSGLPSGTTFQTAYADALNPPDSSWNLLRCQEVDNKWYLDGLNP